MYEICSDNDVRWVWYACEVSGRGGLVWGGERVGGGGGALLMNQFLIQTNCSLFYLRGKSAPIQS